MGVTLYNIVVILEFVSIVSMTGSSPCRATGLSQIRDHAGEDDDAIIITSRMQIVRMGLPDIPVNSTELQALQNVVHKVCVLDEQKFPQLQPGRCMDQSLSVHELCRIATWHPFVVSPTVSPAVFVPDTPSNHLSRWKTWNLPVNARLAFSSANVMSSRACF